MARSNKFQSFFGNVNRSTRLMSAFLDSRNDSHPGTKAGDLQGQIRNDGNTVEIMLHDAIGDAWVGLDSHTLTKTIKESRGKKIVLDINSFGGDAYAGISIYNALANHDSEVVAHITGIGYSAASIIPMAADTIRVAENGSLGIHPAWLWTVGNRFALMDSVNWLTTLDGQIIDTYMARTGQTREKVVAWFNGQNNEGTVFSGKECVEYGFADELIPCKTKSDAGKSDSGKSEATTSAGGTPPAAELKARLAAMQSRHVAVMRAEKIAAMRKELATN